MFLLGDYESEEKDFTSLFSLNMKYSMEEGCPKYVCIGTVWSRQDRKATEGERRELERRMLSKGLWYDPEKERVVGCFEENLKKILEV